MTADLDLEKVLDQAGDDDGPEEHQSEPGGLNGRVDQLPGSNHGSHQDDTGPQR